MKLNEISDFHTIHYELLLGQKRYRILIEMNPELQVHVRVVQVYNVKI